MQLSLEQRIVTLEESAMELTRITEDLSAELVRQGRLLDYLVQQNRLLREALGPGLVKPLSEETPPPHY